MSLDGLIEYFLKFPGVGPRQAKRFAYFLAGESERFAKNLSQAILEIKNSVKQCSLCFRFYQNGANGKCNICSNLNRNKSLLMVVEKDVDLENIERTNIYNGRYFVLGGVISLNAKNNIDNLRFKQLFDLTKDEKPKEIILALSATIEGENTVRYAEKILEPLSSKAGQEIKISKLGRGLSTGTELEYIDSETMSNALKNRTISVL
ncbi:MAG: recombination protein RecR [Candidatus Terrybacteria bacterium]|nr:recombination protein RecR [Candidatus Terrybacteria bacterium]